MKKRKYFFVWLSIVVIFVALLFLFTILFFYKNIEMSVYFSLILADVTLIATLCTFYDKFLLPYVNNHLQERDLTSFVDRILETRTVIDSINNGQKIIYITGRPGIGKKFFLYKLIDIINNEKKLLIGSSVYPLYIDVEAGKNIKQSIREKIGAVNELNNPDLVKELHKVTKSKTVILLINNVNLQLYLNMEEDINALIRTDDNIIFIITTEALMESYKPVEMSKFTDKEVKEIALKKNINISDDICRNIIQKTGGLPILINCFIKQFKLTGNLSDDTESDIFIKKICDKLDFEERELLSLIAYYSIAKVTISMYQVGKYCEYCTKKNILKLVENGLIEFAPQTEEISMQSFFAMRIRELYESKRFQKCVFIYKMLEKSEKENKYKFIFLLLSNIKVMEEAELIEHLSGYLLEKEYYFLIYLFEILEDFNKLNIHYDNKNVRVNLLYCYIHSLLEIGEYETAKQYINKSRTWISDINLRTINSQLEFDFNFDIADMSHFYGDFELAIDSYMKLQKSNINEAQNIKCQWAIGHCYRHLGDIHSMNIASKCFETIIKKSSKINPDYFMRAYQSLILIKLFLDDKDYDYEKAFENQISFLYEAGMDKKEEIMSSRQYALYQRIIMNDYKYSLEILHTALLNLEKKGLRIKYDYYFEIAESLSHKIIIDFNEEDYKESLSYYQRALDFSLKARDISLKNISQLGIILLRIFKRQACANDLNNVIEICDFCNKKKIAYIYNYSCQIKEYLLNIQYSSEKNDELYFNKLVEMRLFIM